MYHDLPPRFLSYGLCLIFVSSGGFLALGSQVTLPLATSYMFAISCSLYSQWHHPEILGQERVGLLQPGKVLGTVVDIIGLYFLLVWVLA